MDNKPFDLNQLQKEKPADVSWEAWNHAIANAGEQPNFAALVQTAREEQLKIDHPDIVRVRAINSDERADAKTQREAERFVQDLVQNMMDIAGRAFTTPEHLKAVIKNTDRMAERMFGKEGKVYAHHMATASVTAAMTASKLAHSDANLDKNAEIQLKLLRADPAASVAINTDSQQLDELRARLEALRSELDKLSKDKRPQLLEALRQEQQHNEQHQEETRERLGDETWKMIQRHRDDKAHPEFKKLADDLNKSADESSKREEEARKRLNPGNNNEQNTGSLSQEEKRKKAYIDTYREQDKAQSTFRQTADAMSQLGIRGGLGPYGALAAMAYESGKIVSQTMMGYTGHNHGDHKQPGMAPDVTQTDDTKPVVPNDAPKTDTKEIALKQHTSVTMPVDKPRVASSPTMTA